MKKTPRKNVVQTETDSIYFLKILLYFMLGLIWVKYNGYLVFPLGLALGVLFTQHDRLAIDRKIEYAILIIATLVGAMGFGVFFAL
jgi:hypothetical protein